MHPERGPIGASLVPKRQEGKLVTKVPESPKLMSYTGSEPFDPSAVYKDLLIKIVKYAKNKG